MIAQNKIHLTWTRLKAAANVVNDIYAAAAAGVTPADSASYVYPPAAGGPGGAGGPAGVVPPSGYETPPTSALTSYMTGQTGAIPSPYGSALYPVDNR